MKRAALGLLLLSLVAALYLRPISCVGKWPWQLFSLWGYLHWQGLAGAQLAGRDSGGELFYCQLGRGADGDVLLAGDALYFASLSKMFAIWLALELEVEGSLDLNSRVLEYVPVAAVKDSRWHEMTLQHLLTHHAGFDRALTPDPMFIERPWCPNRLAEGIASTELDHAPGQVYRYANVGYCLLAEILAKQQGVSVEQLIRREFTLLDSMAITVVPDGMALLDNKHVVIDEADLAWLPLYRAHPAVGAWQGSAIQWRDIWLAQFDRNDAVARQIKRQLFEGECEGDISVWRSCNHLGFYRYQPSAVIAPILWRDGSLPGASAFTGFNSQGAIVVLLVNERKVDWLHLNDWLGRWAAQLIQ